jgi:predicted TIM-barrel fold metal-dependent hydrolase
VRAGAQPQEQSDARALNPSAPPRGQGMIIDCHTHLNRYDPQAPPTLAERWNLLQAEMAANGVDHALVLSSYDITPDRPSTQELLDFIGADPRVGIVAGVSSSRGWVQEVPQLRRLLEARKIKGIKLYPGYQSFYVHDRQLRPVYELAAEFGVPVMIHTGDTFDPRARVKYAHPLEVDEVAVDFREVTFVICHLGSPWFVDAMEVIYKNENVVADISGLTIGEFAPRFEQFALPKLREVMDFINDPSKLLFGTDWPISDIASYLRFVQKLDLTVEEMEGLLWRNAARVFRLARAQEMENRDGIAVE